MKTKTKKWILYISMIIVSLSNITFFNKYIPNAISNPLFNTKFTIVTIASVIVLWGIYWIEKSKV